MDSTSDDIELHNAGGSERMVEGRDSAANLLSLDFFQRVTWVDDMFEILFHVKARETTIRSEMYYGFVHFISCLYVLAVIPQQLVNVGYSDRTSVVITALCCGLGSIIGGFFTNLPFIVAPPTVVSIYLVASMQEKNLGPDVGNGAVVLSGFFLMFLGYKPLAHLIGTLIPLPIQVGTTVGIGLLTALAGATEIGLIKNGGKFQILKKGEFSAEQLIAISGLVIISVAIHYKIKAAFCIALLFCTLVSWTNDDDWPTSASAMPSFHLSGTDALSSKDTSLLAFDLTFLYILYLSGITTSLCNLAGLTRENGEIPRGRWVFIISGIFTMLSGSFNGPPILISPESAAGIKAGAKTGLSTVICGFLFLVSMFLSPIFQHVPHAGTSPVLLMIGTLLFQNVNRLDWSDVKDAAPAFCVLFFIPFMYSVVQGVLMGYYVYLLIGFFTGDLLQNSAQFVKYYSPFLGNKIEYLQHWSSGSRSSEEDVVLSALHDVRAGRARASSCASVRPSQVSGRAGQSNSESLSREASEKLAVAVDRRGRSSSSASIRPTQIYGRSDQANSESFCREASDKLSSDLRYQLDCTDYGFETDPACLEDELAELKALRSIQFAVFD